MKFNVVNTIAGLVPCTDEDGEKKRKLKIGNIYEISIKEKRNYEFHKKYFALINCAWEYQNEAVTAHFKQSSELFRKTVEISAGNCDLVYSIERKEWVEVPKSISFEKMNESDFQDLYERVKDVLFSIFLKSINRKDFEENLKYF